VSSFFLFAPGAGIGSDHPWMAAWAARLESIAPVVRFDYDYRRAGKKLPDKLPTLLAAHRLARDAALTRHPGRSCVLVGRSMGGRVGFHLAAEDPSSPAIALGYPLVSPAGTRRTEALLALRRSALVIQGTRDEFGGPETVREAAAGAPITVVSVEGADHGLEVPARHPVPQETVDATILAEIAAYIAQL
jgi:predicted alpha/beta-hydrolase family hydrolase